MKLKFPDQNQKDFDIACIGRMSIDLYGEQLGVLLEDVSTFAKYLGGSSANIAYGTALLGAKSAMITRVGDEQFGEYLLKQLTRVGCDISQIKKDPKHLTALAILSIRDQAHFPLLFYRQNCADMALTEDDVSEDFIARCRSLLITGTHLSTENTQKACLKALEIAKKHNAIRVLDIDYRPVLWGLTAVRDGENRYVENQEVSKHLLKLLGEFDLIIGTEEEWQIAGGVANDTIASLKTARQITDAIFVVKRGPMGCAVVENEIPQNLDHAPNFNGFPVEVVNVLGAGDAFASGLMSELLKGSDWKQALKVANACGAIVVSRHGCSPAMPTHQELSYFFEHLSGSKYPDKDPYLQHLHHITTPNKHFNELFCLAFDHRIQLSQMCFEEKVSLKKLSELKCLLVTAAKKIEVDNHLEHKFGILCDDQFGRQALYEAQANDWWIGRPLELPSSNPLIFETGRAMPLHVRQWPKNHVMKVLAYYSPDASLENCIEHEQQLTIVQKTAMQTGNKWLLEIIPPFSMTDKTKRESAIYRTVLRLYNLGIKPNWWKIEGVSAATWNALAQLISERDPYCCGIVILGLNEPLATLKQQFSQAQNISLVKGFMVGRSLFSEPARLWLKDQINDQTLIDSVTNNFKELYQEWRKIRP